MQFKRKCLQCSGKTATRNDRLSSQCLQKSERSGSHITSNYTVNPANRTERTFESSKVFFFFSIFTRHSTKSPKVHDKATTFSAQLLLPAGASNSSCNSLTKPGVDKKKKKKFILNSQTQSRCLR